MTQEDKQLLLKDLCARLPYGVKVQSTFYNCDGTIWKYENEILTAGLLGYPITRYKPYLVPLSSMTEEQKRELIKEAGYEKRDEDCGRHQETYYYDLVGHENVLYPNSDAIDWLNAHHFDYRRLIEKSLALDATNLRIYE